VLLNSRHVAELIEQGEVNEIKEAMEKSMTPGSQTFEQSLFKMIRDGAITQEEGLAYADSSNNLLWQLNNAAAGGTAAQPAPPKEAEKPADKGVGGASFSEFKLSLDDEKAA
jgi:twitching motility protein PilU